MGRRRPLTCPRVRLGWLAVGGLLLAACGGPAPVATPEQITATPLVPDTPASPTPTPTAEPSPSSPPTPSPTPSPARSSAVGGPTDTDRARFIAGYRPEGAADLESVAVDLDGDDVQEILFAYVVGGATRIDVSWWTGTAYEVTYHADGGPAERIDRVRVADVNADGRTEVVTHQSTASGSSLSIWQVVGEQALARLRAHGGCWDRSHTYGVVGARLVDDDRDGAEEIHATCDDAPLPVSAWHTDVYEWTDEGYEVRITETPDVDPPEGESTADDG